MPEDHSADLESWVDEQWDQEVRAASAEDYTAASETYLASSHRKGIRVQSLRHAVHRVHRREVALPHRNLKFGRQPRVRIWRVRRRAQRAGRGSRRYGPWNTYDNYWMRQKDRRCANAFRVASHEAQVAYYQNFNRGKDEFGREVLNPAGVDMTPDVARSMGLEEDTRTPGCHGTLSLGPPVGRGPYLLRKARLA